MTELELRAIESPELMRLHAELAQLKFKNDWLRRANKGLCEELKRIRDTLPPPGALT